MSEYYGIKIVYREPFSRESVRTVLTALREAVADNWRLYRNEFTTDTLFHLVDVDAWTEIVFTKPMDRAPDYEGGYEWVPTPGFDTSFCPVNSFDGSASVSLLRYPGGMLGLGYSIPDSLFTETLGERELWRIYREWHRSYVARTGKEPKNVHAPYIPDDGFASDEEYFAWNDRRNELENMPPAYPVTQQCLYNVLHHLEKVYPVARVKIDDEIKAGEKGPD